MLDLLALVSKAPKSSLVIIDEVEASLHPQAQRGLMTELLRLAFDKKLQILLSTHSPYILEQLPAVARVFVSLDRDARRQVLYGVSADFALNQMDDEQHEELDLYCEDDEAVYLIERILAVGSPASLQRVRITPVGPANAVKTLASIAIHDKLPRATICVVDADQEPSADYMVLPGTQAPEREAFTAFDDANWTAVAERLGRTAGDVLDAKDRAMALANHHAWTGEISKHLGGTMRRTKVWEAIADVWVVDVLGEVKVIEWVDRIEAKLRDLAA